MKIVENLLHGCIKYVMTTVAIELPFLNYLVATESRDEVSYGGITEKVTQIRAYSGNKYKLVDHVHAGELFAVTGLTKATIGDGIGVLKERASFEMIPTLKSKVVFDPSIQSKKCCVVSTY